MKDICRSCGAAILWVKTQSGKPIPVDAAECLDGNVWVAACERGLTAFFPPEGVTIPDATRHRSHFASCAGISVHHHRPKPVPAGALAVDVELHRYADDGNPHADADELFPHDVGGEA